MEYPNSMPKNSIQIRKIDALNNEEIFSILSCKCWLSIGRGEQLLALIPCVLFTTLNIVKI